MKKFTFLFFLMFAVCVGYVAAQDYQPENTPAQQPKETTELQRKWITSLELLTKWTLKRR